MSDSFSLSTRTVHGDDHVNTLAPSLRTTLQDVAPSLHVSTTFRYTKDPEKLKEAKDVDIHALEGHVYSRESAPNTTRLEAVLSTVIGGKTLCYSSGLAAIFAAYTYLKPKRVSVGAGYHGTHGVLNIHTRLTGLEQLPLDCPTDALEAGDIIHLETPCNPTGVAFDIAHYAAKAHSRGAFLIVDSTMAPPPLQDAFALGADLVMHSGTKYFGGHSDLLCGVLAMRNEEWYKGMWLDRVDLGSVMGNMESWLTVRSLRTLELRVLRQSESAGLIVRWLEAALKGPPLDGQKTPTSAGLDTDFDLVKGKFLEMFHSSLQVDDYLPTQMPNGFNPVFGAHFHTPEQAKVFCSRLHLFQHATSFGGVESLVEWRAMSDETVDRRLVRFSVGVEDVGDLMADIRQALEGI